MADDHDDRLTILERAQRLHDAVLQRHETDLQWHKAVLERHETEMAEHARRLRRLDDLQAQQTLTHRALVEGFARLEERVDHLDATLVAIKDLLERW
jgi:hypothetical protein